MKKLNILKTLIDLFFIFALIATVGMIVFVPFVLFSSEGIPIKMRGEEITVLDWQTKLLMVFVLISAIIFIYGIYLLRKVIAIFMKRELFHVDVIRHLNTIGICLIASSLLTSVPVFFYDMLHKNHVGVEFSNGGLDSTLVSVSLGLFFMVLSEVFKIAKTLKEENDLTV